MATDSRRSDDFAIVKLQRARRKRLYEEIVAQIQGLIASGHLKAGDQLPPERELAEIFKVSRNSVREAIKALEEKQILNSRPGDGTYVLVQEERSFVEPLASAIQQEKDKLQEIFQFRRLIEPQIAYMAAEVITAPEDLDRLRNILADHEREIKAGHNAIEQDIAFHMYLVSALNNSVLLKIIAILSEALRETRSETVQNKEQQAQSLQAHQRILKAIAAGDSEGAWREMQNHLVSTEQMVFDH